MRFQVKEQEYFLAFVEQERRWYVFAPRASGVDRIPVYVDAASYDRPGIMSEETHPAS